MTLTDGTLRWSPFLWITAIACVPSVLRASSFPNTFKSFCCSSSTCFEPIFLASTFQSDDTIAIQSHLLVERNCRVSRRAWIQIYLKPLGEKNVFIGFFSGYKKSLMKEYQMTKCMAYWDKCILCFTFLCHPGRHISYYLCVLCLCGFPSQLNSRMFKPII